MACWSLEDVDAISHVMIGQTQVSEAMTGNGRSFEHGSCYDIHAVRIAGSMNEITESSLRCTT